MASTVSYQWMGPAREDADELRYEAIRLRLPGNRQEVEIQKGDTVRLITPRSSLDWICRIESLFTYGQDPQFRGRWFYGITDLQALRPKCTLKAEVQALNDTLEAMDDDDLVLSNLEEINDVAAILELVTVEYQPPLRDLESGTSAEPRPIAADHTRVCRFYLDWDPAFKSFQIFPVQPKLPDDQVSWATSSSDDSNPNHDTGKGNRTVPREEEIDDDYRTSTGSERHVIQEGEGGTLRGNTMVGDKYQVTVDPFVPNRLVPSRCPTLVYKPGCISESEMQQFADELADYHTPYLETRDLVIATQPYTPLTGTKADALRETLLPDGQLTGSTISSASVFLGITPSHLLKECDVDEVLLLLSTHNFDRKEALMAIQCNTDQISTSWSATEREIFDSAYRQHQGALRSVAQALHPTKTMKDVIDYFYRFKIPDQFRLYQDKKREQAALLMECIEKRRAGIAITISHNDDGESDLESSKMKRWQDTPVEDIVGTLEIRRHKAKKLLLEVNNRFGREFLAKISAMIERLHSSQDRDAKEALLCCFSGCPDMQRRFLEFLPVDL